jgi:serine protease Do
VHFPKLPDWLIYGAVVSALLVVAIGRQERSDAPPPPPPVPGDVGLPLGPASPFDPSIVVRGVAARITLDPAGDAAILTTEGGAPAVPLRAAAEPPRRGERAYHPGFPQGHPGEVTSRLLGRENLVIRGRGARVEPVLVWAEVGRTDNLKGTLSGLSGAPALDSTGRVIGVTVAESPRRGRIYTTAQETVEDLLKQSRRRPASFALGEAITTENYGRVADGLRRDLRVAQVVCLKTEA